MELELNLRLAWDRPLKHCHDLDITTRLKKSDLQPKNQSKYLDILVDSVSLRVFSRLQDLQVQGGNDAILGSSLTSRSSVAVGSRLHGLPREVGSLLPTSDAVLSVSTEGVPVHL